MADVNMISSDEAAHFVSEMMQTRGWREVIYPALMAHKQTLFDNVASCDNFRDFLKIRERLAAIDWLLGCMNITILEGIKKSEGKHPYSGQSKQTSSNDEIPDDPNQE